MVPHRHPSFRSPSRPCRSPLRQVRSLPVRVQRRSPVRWATRLRSGLRGVSCPVPRARANSRTPKGESSIHPCCQVHPQTWRLRPLRACSVSCRRQAPSCLWDRIPVRMGRRLPVGPRAFRERPGFRTRLRGERRSSRRSPCRWFLGPGCSRRQRALSWAVSRSRCSWRGCPPVRMRSSSLARSREPAPARHLELHRTQGRRPDPPWNPLPPRRIRPRHAAMPGRSTLPRSSTAALPEGSAPWVRRRVSQRLSRRAECGRRRRRGVRRPRPSQPVRRYPAPDSSRRSGRTRTPLAQVELWNSTASLMGATGRSPSIARAGPSGVRGGRRRGRCRTKSVNSPRRAERRRGSRLSTESASGAECPHDLVR